MEKLKLIPIEVVLLLVAFWHSLYWFVLRSVDSSDEPWGLLSLATVAIFVFASWTRTNSFSTGSVVPVSIALMVLYCASFSIAPPLVRCLIAACTFGVVIWSRCDPEKRNTIALFGLLVLSSPLISSLQFFLGFPLRLLVTNTAAIIMRAQGFQVSVAGTMFEYQKHMVAVDSPCSGINMMWAGLYLCFVLCWMKRLSLQRSLMLLAASGFGVIATNVARTMGLFQLEVFKSSGRTFPENAHDAIGMASFVSLALFVVWLANMLAKSSVVSTSTRENSVQHARPETIAIGPEAIGTNFVRSLSLPGKLRRARGGLPAQISFAVVCLITAALPLVQSPYHESASKPQTSNWPDQFEGRALKPVQLSCSETKFSSGFPGRIAKFSDGQRTILFRQVSKPTRQLHPSSDCYRGSNFQLHPMAALRDTQGKIWSRFAARKQGQKLEVREIVTDSKGQTWSDTSAWYWSALLGKTQSPWTAVTVAAVAK